MISKHLRLLRELDKYDIQQLHSDNDREIEDIFLKLDPALVKPTDVYAVKEARLQLNKSYQNLQKSLGDIKERLQDQIKSQSKDYLHKSMQWFLLEQPHETIQHRLGRKLILDENTRQLIEGWLLRFGDWRYPGMIISPKQDQWINLLLGLDPMYLLDTEMSMLDPLLQSVPVNYRNRLCCYIVKENPKEPFLTELPRDQFYFIFAYNFFNYRPLEIIYKWLEELWWITTSGGHLMFTFNDCDHPHGVALSEQGNYMCYTPGSLIVAYASSLGWIVEDRHLGLNDAAYLLLKKPGEPRSYRGAQCLAEVLAKSK